MDIFQSLTHTVAISTIAFSSFLGFPHTVTSNHTVITSHREKTEQYYITDKTIRTHGYSMSIYMKIPKNGGTVVGKVSGSCTGDITGQYDGENKGNITGHTAASCTAFFIHIPASATFRGIITKPTMTMDIHIDAKAGTVERTETLALQLHQ